MWTVLVAPGKKDPIPSYVIVQEAKHKVNESTYHIGVLTGVKKIIHWKKNPTFLGAPVWTEYILATTIMLIFTDEGIKN